MPNFPINLKVAKTVAESNNSAYYRYSSIVTSPIIDQDITHILSISKDFQEGLRSIFPNSFNDAAIYSCEIISPILCEIVQETVLLVDSELFISDDKASIEVRSSLGFSIILPELLKISENEASFIIYRIDLDIICKFPNRNLFNNTFNNSQIRRLHDLSLKYDISQNIINFVDEMIIRRFLSCFSVKKQDSLVSDWLRAVKMGETTCFSPPPKIVAMINQESRSLDLL